MERGQSFAEDSQRLEAPAGRRVGGTVLELMAEMSAAERIEPATGVNMPGTSYTMETTTRSGDGYAQIADDSQGDHLLD